MQNKRNLHLNFPCCFQRFFDLCSRRVWFLENGQLTANESITRVTTKKRPHSIPPYKRCRCIQVIARTYLSSWVSVTWSEAWFFVWKWICGPLAITFATKMSVETDQIEENIMCLKKVWFFDHQSRALGSEFWRHIYFYWRLYII